MRELLRKILLKTDWLIRHILGERPLPTYRLPVKATDSLESAERKLLTDYFKVQSPIFLQRLLVVYLRSRHVAAMILKGPIRLIRKGLGRGR